MRGLQLEKRASLGAVMGTMGFVLGLAALLISLGSTADATAHHAPHKITAKQLAPGAVTGKAIRKGAVGKKALGEGVVTNAALADNAVNARTLGEGSVTQRAIAPAAVTHGAIAPGSVSSSTLTTETIHVTPLPTMMQSLPTRNGRRVTPKTRAPCMAAICAATCPTMPFAASTSTTSPGLGMPER